MLNRLLKETKTEKAKLFCENSCLRVELAKKTDASEEKNKLLMNELAGEKDLVSKLKATIRRLQQCSSSSEHDTTFKLPSAAASAEERTPLKELTEPLSRNQPLPFHTAKMMIGGSETCRAAALMNANDYIAKLEKHNRQLSAKLEKSEKDANDWHKCASAWKTRFMKIKTEAAEAHVIKFEV